MKRSLLCVCLLIFSLFQPSRAVQAQSAGEILGGVLGILIESEIRRNQKSNRPAKPRPATNPAAAQEPRMSKVTRQEVQSALNLQGYSAGVEDGVLGRGTRKSIKRYQAANGYRQTGYLTAAQLQELSGIYTQALERDDPGLSRPLSKQELKQLQLALKHLRYYSGKVDGIAGRGTANAISRYLADRGHNANTVSTETAYNLAMGETGLEPSGNWSGGGITGAQSDRRGPVVIGGVQPDRRGPVVIPAGFPTLEGREIIDVGRTGYIDSKGMLRLALAARPDLLDNPAILAKVYKRLSRTSINTRDISEQTYAQFKIRTLKEIEQQGPVRGVFRYLTSLNNKVYSHRYQVNTSNWPVFYGGGPFDRYPIWSLDYTGIPKLAVEFPEDMVLDYIHLSPGLATELLATNRNASHVGHVNMFVTISALHYDANRDQYTADIRYEGTNFVVLNGKTLVEVLPKGATVSPNSGSTIPSGYLAIAKIFRTSVSVIDGYISGKYRKAVNGRRPTGIWKIYTSLAFLDQNPELLQNDYYAVAFAPRMLTHRETKRFWRGYKSRTISDLNQFDLRDLADRMRSEFGDLLRARAFSGPYRFFTVRDATIGAYDFDTSTFALSVDSKRSIELIAGVDKSINAKFDYANSFPSEFAMSAQRAREMAARLKMGARGFKAYLQILTEADHMTVPTLSAPQIVENSKRSGMGEITGQFGLTGRIVGLRLYSDASLSNLIYEFSPDEFTVRPSENTTQDGTLTAIDVINLPLAPPDTVAALANQVPGGEGFMHNLIAAQGTGDRVMDRLAKGLENVDPDLGGWFFVRSSFSKVEGKPGIRTFSGATAGRPLVYSTSTDNHEMSWGWSVSNIDLDIEFDAKVVARRGGNLFPTDDYNGQIKAGWTWLRMRPVSVEQKAVDGDASNIRATVAWEILEYYVIAGDLKLMGPLDILAHQKLDGAGRGNSAPDLTAGGIADSVGFTPDLLPTLAIMANGGEAALGKGGLDWFVMNRWVIDNGAVGGLPGRAFANVSTIPQGPLLARARSEMQHYLGTLENSVPTKIEMVAAYSSASGRATDAGCNALVAGIAPWGYTEIDYSERYTKLLELANLPTIMEINAAYTSTESRSSWQKPAAAPWAVLYPRNISSLECVFDYDLNEVIQEVLGAQAGDLDDHLHYKGTLPLVMVAVENFPAIYQEHGQANYALRFSAEVVKIHTVDSGGIFPDILVVVRTDGYEIVEPQVASQNGNASFNVIGNIALQDMVAAPSTKPDGSAYDVLGITLDTSIAEADKILRKRFGDPMVLRSADSAAGVQPFRNAWAYVKPDLSEVVTLFVEDTTGEDRILAVQRVLNISGLPYPIAAVRNQAIEKYGKPQALFPSQPLLLEWGDWVVDQNNEKTLCRASNYRGRERIELWRTEENTSVTWWGNFDWNSIRDTYVPWVPGLINFSSRSKSYAECGTYLGLNYDEFGMVTILIDLAAYEEALLAEPVMPAAQSNASEPAVKIDF